MDTLHQSTYRAAGVDTEQEEGGLGVLRQWVERTFAFGLGRSSVRLPLGYYANVIDVGNNLGIAVSTDGVGTKLLVAQALGKLDTVGIDCVAMNVNDVVCVGAQPLTMVDYIAVETADPELLGELAKGLYEGARIADISIPGGEVAQVREMIRGAAPGRGCDLVGTCVGTVDVDRILFGRSSAEGDVLIGIRSSGVHSNGLTLARHVFFEQQRWKPERHVAEFGRSVGEELLEPTLIYSGLAMTLLRERIDVKAFAHITSDGFLNLTRADADVEYVIDSLPDPHPVFGLIQKCGNVSDEEMFRVYNMGIGFCVVAAAGDADRAVALCRAQGFEAQVIGHLRESSVRRVRLTQQNLLGVNGEFCRC